MKKRYNEINGIIEDLSNGEIQSGFLLLWSINERLLFKFNDIKSLSELIQTKAPYEFRMFNQQLEIHAKKIGKEWLCTLKTDKLAEMFEDEKQMADNELNKEIQKCLGNEGNASAVSFFHIRKYIKYDDIGLAKFFAVRLFDVTITSK